MNEEDKKEVEKLLTPLQDELKQLRTDLNALPQGTKDETWNNRRARFSESGNWGRHYSTVRMGVTTFLISLSLGILTFGWQYWAPRPRPAFVFVSVGIWFLAIFLFTAFSVRTYKASKSQRTHRLNLTTGYTTTDKKPAKFDGACVAMLLITIGFGLLLTYLYCPYWNGSGPDESGPAIVAPVTPGPSALPATTPGSSPAP